MMYDIVQRDLERYAAMYETEAFLQGDPSWFMHQVEGAANQEAVAFVASCLSYGSRKQFMPKIQWLLDCAEGEGDAWVREGAFEEVLPAAGCGCFYRLNTVGQMNDFLRAYRRLLLKYGTLGAYETCIIKTCEEDYHLASNACVANEQVCTVANGVGVKTWNADRKDWDPCEATSCAPGYTNDPSEKNNASEQCSECRNKVSILGEVAASGYITGCEIATCMYQGEKYNLENNECVPICDRPYSDETGSVMWNDMLKKCVRTCNPGYMSW